MRIPAGFLPHTITAAPYLGESAYGPKYGAEAEYRARVEFTSGITQDKEGRDTQYTARLFLEPEADISPDTALSYVDSRGKPYKLIVITAEPMSSIQGSVTHVEATARYG